MENKCDSCTHKDTAIQICLRCKHFYINGKYEDDLEDLYKRDISVRECDTCGKLKSDVTERSDNELNSGKHCSECWNELVSSCRKRSW